MLATYTSIIAIPRDGWEPDEPTNVKTFKAIAFDAGVNMSVPELAEMTFNTIVRNSDMEIPSGSVIVRISREDPSYYEYNDGYRCMTSGDYVGYTDTVLYRNEDYDGDYEDFFLHPDKYREEPKIPKDAGSSEQAKPSDSGSFGPSIPDEEIPF